MNATSPSSSPTSRPWLWPVVLIFGTLAGAAIPELFARGYYHYDDNMHLFLPTFYEIGTQLRMGHMPWISDRSWLGGNFIGEGQFALFNPFSLALYAWMSTMPETAVSAFVFATFHLLVLAIGVYLLVVNLGGRAAYAAAAGVAAANTSIVSYWYAAAWWNALVADAWLLVALAFWAKFMMRGKGLLPAVLFGALSMVSGWPHGWIALGIFIALFAFVAWRQGDKRRAATILGGGIATLLLALPAIAPVIDYAQLSERRSAVGNGGDMVGTLESLLALSWPAYLPPIHRIYGWVAEAPLTFAAWFVAPILLAGRHQLLALRREPAMAVLGIGIVVFFLLSLGPERFFFLRWPMRFIFYYQTLLIVLAMLVLSAPDAVSHLRRERSALAAYAALMLYLGFASDPTEVARQAVLSLMCVLFLLRLFGPGAARTIAPLLIATTLGCVLAIHYLWPRHPNLSDWQGPPSVKTDDVRPPAFSGNTVILHAQTGRKSDDLLQERLAAIDSTPSVPSGAMTFWSIPYAINGYSALPHAGLRSALCFNNQWGHSCQDSLQRLFEIPPGLPLRRDELFNVSEIRVRSLRLASSTVKIPPEWQLSDGADGILTFRRSIPLVRPAGSVAWAARGLQITSIAPPTTMSEHLRVTNTEDQPRRVIFARPPYPGFAVRLNGERLVATAADGSMLSVMIPARASGELTLSYSPPHLAMTSGSAFVGLLLAGFLHRRRRN